MARRVFVAQDCDHFFMHDRRVPVETGYDYLEEATWPGGPSSLADDPEARRWFVEEYCPQHGIRPEFV